jgi:CRISPR-associated protein Csd1
MGQRGDQGVILQTLYEHYLRLVRRNTELPLLGFGVEQISYCLEIGTAGELLGVIPLLDTSGKKARPRLLIVPQLPEQRTSGIKSNFLWDKTAYSLGQSNKSKRTESEHAAFLSLHRELLAGTEDTGLKAFLRFLTEWKPETGSPLLLVEPGVIDANIGFKLRGDSQFLHERHEAKQIWERSVVNQDEAAAAKTPDQQCLVSGTVGLLARVHAPIRGVDNAQSSGASIVSFTQSSFCSYQLVDGANAPVSASAAFAYTTVLRYLLRREPSNRQRLNIGDATVVFWAESDDPEESEAAEWTFAALATDRETDEQATGRVRLALELVAKGRPVSDIHPKLKPDTHLVVLGLAPNASRLSIRYWMRDTMADLVARLASHAQDLLLEPAPWKTPPTPWRLALSTAPSRDGKSKAEDVSPLLAGELMRAILTGNRYPQSLLANLIMRMRADGDVSGIRVALCKAVINRDRRLGESPLSSEEVSVSLDLQATHPGYLLGRLFAVLEGAQRSALGGQVNATIRDRYFGAASATPALVLPMLLRNAQNHLSRLRKDKPGLAVLLEKELQEIIDKLPDHFPRSLDLKDQGRFAIGYYHQTSARFKKDHEPISDTMTNEA